MVNDLVLRAETLDDYDAIRDVVTAAFKSPVEALLVDNIRATPEYVPAWALVAEVDGTIVGHVMMSYAALLSLDDAPAVDGPGRIAMLSPLAVAPESERRGIGSALVRAACGLADTAGEPAVMLEGSPVYYGRFGFEHARPLGIHIALPSWAPDEAGQLLRLTRHSANFAGKVVYTSAFDGVTDH